MGWIELHGWIRELNRQRTPPEASVDTWDDRDRDEWWRLQDEIRAKNSGVSSRRR